MNEVKRKVRSLKKVEQRIRSGNLSDSNFALVWNDFFDLSGSPNTSAKYSLAELSAMSREEWKSVTDAFFSNVYYKYYLENGIASNMYSPALLDKLDLPYDADEQVIKKKFRELAKKLHPDTGGDATKFIELMSVYRELV